MKKPVCPACGSADSVSRRKLGTENYWECEDCGLLLDSAGELITRIPDHKDSGFVFYERAIPLCYKADDDERELK